MENTSGGKGHKLEEKQTINSTIFMSFQWSLLSSSIFNYKRGLIFLNRYSLLLIGVSLHCIQEHRIL